MKNRQVIQRLLWRSWWWHNYRGLLVRRNEKRLLLASKKHLYGNKSRKHSYAYYKRITQTKRTYQYQWYKNLNLQR